MARRPGRWFSITFLYYLPLPIHLAGRWPVSSGLSTGWFAVGTVTTAATSRILTAVYVVDFAAIPHGQF